jgi:hypothetical protein
MTGSSRHAHLACHAVCAPLEDDPHPEPPARMPSLHRLLSMALTTSVDQPPAHAVILTSCPQTCTTCRDGVESDGQRYLLHANFDVHSYLHAHIRYIHTTHTRRAAPHASPARRRAQQLLTVVPVSSRAPAYGAAEQHWRVGSSARYAYGHPRSRVYQVKWTPAKAECQKCIRAAAVPISSA